MTATTKTVKAVNYTAEQTAAILAGYDPKADEGTRKAQVEALAVQLGKTAKSIIAKLTKEKVYVAKAYKTKQGEAPVKKDETADAIGRILRLSDGEVDSLTKANKTALVKIFAALANSRPIDGDEGEPEKAE